MSGDELASAIGKEAAGEMASALNRIEHCLDQLNDEQVWWRPAPTMNSIGNLLLHLSGNLQQWIVVGLGGGVDRRNRPVEFSEAGPIPKAELLRRLAATVEEARNVLRRQAAPQLLAVRRIQGDDVTGLAAIFNSIPHFRGHTQEIIHLTRTQLRDAYEFAWKPQTPEEGA